MRKTKLHVVPTELDPLKGGDLLSYAHGSLIDNESDLGSILELYFTWSDQASVLISNGRGPDGNTLFDNCTLSYDKDEATPTELWINTKNREISPFSKLILRISVFRICYDLNVNVIATEIDQTNNANVTIITTFPNSAMVIKERRLPRYKLQNSHLAKIIVKSESAEYSCQIDEVGPASMAIRSNHSIPNGTQCELHYMNLIALVEIAGSRSGRMFVQAKESSQNSSGAIFDMFLKAAEIPILPRRNANLEDVFKLYCESGYFSSFNERENQDTSLELVQTWEQVASGMHDSTADYISLDENKNIVGASSLALSHLQEGIEIWSMHQMCALKNPSLLHLSGILYTWRAEYLTARNAPSIATGCYRSQSRWVERIYTKHVRSSPTSKLVPTRNGKVLPKSANLDATESVQVNSFSIGDTIRHYKVLNNITACCGPFRLNANGNLDTVVVHGMARSEEIEYAVNLLGKFQSDPREVLITIINESNSNYQFDRLQLSDRMFSIPRENLLDFMSAVEHSVAVTAKKYDKHQVT